MSSTQGHRQSPPHSSIPWNGCPSSSRDCEIVTKDRSRYERGAGDAQCRGYDVSEHHDKNINHHQYQNTFGVLETGEGGSDVRLPAIRTINELPHEGNGLTTSGRDTAGRLLENQNAHSIEDQSKGLRLYADALAYRRM